jgi:hypothetical protein
MSRWARFFIVLFIGIGVGLLYGWVIDPVEYVDTYPDALREDYKALYVLMVAETYQMERDLDRAVEQLAFFEDTPESLVETTLYFAVQHEYPVTDLGTLRMLSDAILAESNINGETQP